MSRIKNSAGHVLGGRYTLLAPIAQGGMGEVWKARDRETGQLVAAKVLKSELSGEELSLSRLRLEARNAMSVQHPNIANVQDSGEEDGRGWIIMELVEGKPLTHYLRGGSRIEPVDLLPILMQIAMALGAAAQAGVVHRDIKPANVLVRPDGMVKLTDFGISRASDQVDLTAAGMVMGTAQYLPPEQAMGEKATSIGDLYALGVIAYEAVAGRRPFTGETQVDIAFSHVNDPVPPLPSDVPQPFADVVLHLLEKDPSKRPESGVAVVRELSAAARAMGISVSAHPLPEPQREGEVDDPVSAALSSLPPVRHVRKRQLPDSMLQEPEGLRDVRPVTPAVGAATTSAPEVGTPAAPVLAASAPATPAPAAPVTPAPAAPVPVAPEPDSATPPVHSDEAAANAPEPPAASTPERPEAHTAADDGAEGDPNAQRRNALVARLRERARAREEAQRDEAPHPPKSRESATGPQVTYLTGLAAARLHASDVKQPLERTLDMPPDLLPMAARKGRLPEPELTMPWQPTRSSSPESKRSKSKRPASKRSKLTGQRSGAAKAATRSALPQGIPEPRSGTPRPLPQGMWYAVSDKAVGLAQQTPIAPTAYNRSVVAPPVPLGRRILRGVLIALIICVMIAVAAYFVHNKLGSLTSVIGQGSHVHEEVRTWLTPLAV